MQMRKPILTVLTAAAVSVGGGLAGAGCDRDDDVAVNTNPPATTPSGGGEVEPRTAGERVGDVGEVMPDSIYEVLAEATEAAVTPNGFDDLVERLAENDQGRFAGIAEADFKPLDDRVNPLRAAYKGKYGLDFDINDPAAVFRPLVNIQPAGTTGDKQFARVTIQPKASAAGKKLAPYDITMIKDDSWHIDVPENYDRESLRSELVTHLGMVGQGTGENAWPADKLEAQRLVAYHVLAALANSAVGGATEDATPGAPEAPAGGGGGGGQSR